MFTGDLEVLELVCRVFRSDLELVNIVFTGDFELVFNVLSGFSLGSEWAY